MLGKHDLKIFEILFEMYNFIMIIRGYCMVLYGTVWYCMVLYGPMVLYGTVWYCMVLLCCTTLCHMSSTFLQPTYS